MLCITTFRSTMDRITVLLAYVLTVLYFCHYFRVYSFYLLKRLLKSNMLCYGGSSLIPLRFTTSLDCIIFLVLELISGCFTCTDL